jgi:porin
MAEKGVQFEVSWVQTVQSVIEGGLQSGSKYGGSLDYLLLLDLQRMGLMPGALLKVKAETRYGESVNGRSGSILPVSTDGFFPLTTPISDGLAVSVTNLTYFQYFSEQLGVFVGKFDGLDGDANEFASGRGDTQFMNIQLLLSGTLGLLPYSTVGGGVVAMPSKWAKVQSSVFSLTDSSTTTGLSDCQGWVSATEGMVQYRVGELPGGMNLGGVYIWGSEFFDFSGRFTFERGQGLVPPESSDTWIAYWSGWQYIYTPESAAGPINVTDGRPDLEGFGLFWRTSQADEDVNPAKWTVSGGIGGRGMIPGRKRDAYGVGYYYNSVQSERLLERSQRGDSTQGVECFYSIEVTPAAHLTLGAQWVDSVAARVDDAVILGMRLKIDF